MHKRAEVFLDEMGEFFHTSVLTNKQTFQTLVLYNDEKELSVTGLAGKSEDKKTKHSHHLLRQTFQKLSVSLLMRFSSSR